MTYADPSDGITRLSRGEEYRVRGTVLIAVEVSFRTDSEPGDAGYEDDLAAAVDDAIASGDYSVYSDDDLDLEAEDSEPDI